MEITERIRRRFRNVFELRVNSLHLEQYIILLSQTYCMDTYQQKVGSSKGGIKIRRDQNLSKPKVDNQLRVNLVICPYNAKSSSPCSKTVHTKFTKPLSF